MKIQSKPIVKRFELEADEDGQAWVEIRQARWGEQQKRADVVSTMRYITYDKVAGKNAVEQDFNPLQAKAYDIYLTLSGIGGLYDEDGAEFKPFKFRDRGGVGVVVDSPDTFMDKLGQYFDTDVVEEIHSYVLDVNPQFASNRAGE